MTEPSKMNELEIAAQVRPVAESFGAFIRDPQIRGALDRLSADVMAQADEFFDNHIDAIRKAFPDATAEDIVSAVMGWILGFAAGKTHGDDRMEILMRHQTIAAYVAPWSAENAARVYKRIVR